MGIYTYDICKPYMYTYVYIHMFLGSKSPNTCTPTLKLAEVERIQLGEEISHKFVADIIKVAEEQWNHCLDELFQKIEEPKYLLALINEKVTGKGEKFVEQTMEEIREVLGERLKKICLTKTDANLLPLILSWQGFVFKCFDFMCIPLLIGRYFDIDIEIYMYIYIYWRCNILFLRH